ncbi:hypothetical protein [Gordonia humi]|uniref:Lipoprotein n=1 Tax=Gordonia humi TaxID=686429 RepID=A0A840F7H4_9ACTN|nr:hypothetical protein [Gordonia humi]MBB4135477.1 hypothetical protein [Gordonia humi]
MSRSVAVAAGCVLVVVAATVAGCAPAGADIDGRRDYSAPLPSPCELADTESLAFLTGEFAQQMAQPFTFDHVDCDGLVATAYTVPDGVTPPAAVRFEYSTGMWRPIAVAPA